MTEFSHFSGDHVSQPAEAEFIDILQTQAWADYCAAVVVTEQAIVQDDPDDIYLEAPRIERANRMSELFGIEYIGNRCHVSAAGYKVDDEKNISTEPFALQEEYPATFYGTDIQRMNGRWQVLLEFYINRQAGDDIHGSYYVLPNSDYLAKLQVTSHELADIDSVEDLEDYANGEVQSDAVESLLDEQESSAPTESFTDKLQDPAWLAFMAQAQSAESDMVLCDQTDDVRAILRHHNDELRRVFGYEHLGQRSKLFGLGYPISELGEIASEPVAFDTSSVSIHDVEMRYMHDKWRAVIEFQFHEANADTPYGMYYAPVVDGRILELEISDQNQHELEAVTIVHFLTKQVVASQAFVADDEFQQAPADKQRTMLQAIADNIDDAMPDEFREYNVLVECSEYYAVRDDMPGFALQDLYTDHTDTLIEDRVPLKGKIDRFDYPELQTVSDDQQLTTDILFVNDGACCMVLRDDSEKVTYYILPQSIDDII